MGSGENWLGYHLVVHFALHEYFVNHNRPVPRFLFLDQPSQVYFPRDEEGNLKESLDDLDQGDREKVMRMYKLITKINTDLRGQLQIIITDHADLKESFFKKRIVERWRDGVSLIPKDWA